jgi:poly-gamma-glutamate capsule biosynthesis protein CapA/YwtB (metallophosphatase superfamily)
MSARKLGVQCWQRSLARIGLLAACAVLPSITIAQEAGEALSVAEPVPSVPIEDGFTLAAAGDLIYLRPMLATLERRSPELLRLLRDADATFGNFETAVIDLKAFKGSPQAESGGTWMLADPGVVGDVRAMGFDILSLANNHSTDWGVEGMHETMRRLDDAGLVHAGTGASLSAARAPRYVDLPAGRIGLVAATATFTPMSPAADPWGQVPGRAGVNMLRAEEVALVDAADLPALRRIFGIAKERPLTINEKRIEGRAPHVSATVRYITNVADRTANQAAIRQAKQNGNFVIYSLHSHEPGNESELPADLAIEAARGAIDQGADIFVGHGPHRLRGIEIYKGKPIFYSLANFAMMNNSLDVVPPDMLEEYGVQPGSATVPEILQARNARVFGDRDLYESVIAINRFVGGNVSEIRLYPIDLGVAAQGAARGVPAMADAVVGRRILERLQRLSAPFGTQIAIEDGVGVIRIAPVQPAAKAAPEKAAP